tara:strand:+ start:9130 stop:9615 length:486 start_codon:yes stop_codon:yes gene_type:complete
MSLCLSGCGLFHKQSAKEEVWSKFGIDSLHFQSCGPQALSQMHTHFGEDITMQMVSIHLQEHRGINVFRGLGLIHTEFRKITCPPELRAYLKRNGFRYELANYEDLQKGDFAIVLLKGYDDIHEWHWATWPNDSKSIPTFFKNYTKIIKVYKIIKLNQISP